MTRNKMNTIELDDFISQNRTVEEIHLIEKEVSKLYLEYQLSLIRKELKISQKELSKTLGISQPALSDIEKIGKDMRISTLKKYIEGLGGAVHVSVSLPTGKEVNLNI